MIKNIIFVLLAIVMIDTTCVNAQVVLSKNPQWIPTNCPLSPNALIVHNGYLFAGADNGASRSSDDGNTWHVVNNGLSSLPSVLSFCSFGDKLLGGAFYSGGLYLSTNNGDNWKPYGTSQRITSFVIHNNYIFGSTSTWSLVRSTDSGATWQFPDTTYGEMTFLHHSDDVSCSAVTANTNFVFAANDHGNIYRSSNNGDSWEHIFTSTDSLGGEVYAMTALDSLIIVEMYGSLIRSTDNGNTWSLIHNINFTARTFITFNDLIFTGGYYGVQYSSDGGENWNVLNTGLPDSASIDAFAINDGYLFAGAYVTGSISAGGLWRIPLSDFASAVKTNDVPKQTPTVSIVNDNIQFNNVDNSIDKIIFYNATGQVVKEIKNVASLPVKDFSSGFYEVVFSSKTTIMYTTKIILNK